MTEPWAGDAIPAAQLPELMLEPSWADIDPDERRCLVVNLASAQSLTPAEMAQAQRWLREQPLPVIGTGQTVGAESEVLGGAMDLLVANDAELRRGLRNIHQAPIAAAVLVQVLRAVPALSLLDGLVLESLAYGTLQGGREFAAWLAGREPAPAAQAPPTDTIVRVERVGDRLEIVLNSPETRNALSVAMRDALADAFKLVAMDPSITAVEVSANGPCFSAGGELGEFGLREDPATAHRIRMLRNPARYLAPHAGRYRFHLHRACIGAGIELPAFAGRLTAAPNTFFQLPELGMGLIPGAGGCVSLCRRIGPQRTAYMALLGKKISAGRALEWGLIDAVVD